MLVRREGDSMSRKRKASLNDEIVVRHAVPSDRGTLVELNRRSALANPGDRAQLMEHPDAIDVPEAHLLDNRVLVAVADDRVLGFATVLPRPDGDAELDALFVDPRAWRRGIGRTLVDCCLAEAERGGARALYVIGNPHARAFYDACGFVTLEIMHMQYGKGLLMRKRISCSAGRL